MEIMSYEEFNNMVLKISKFLQKYDRIITDLLELKQQHNNKILSGEYSDIDLENIIIKNFEDYKIYVLSFGLQMDCLDNLEDEIRNDKYYMIKLILKKECIYGLKQFKIFEEIYTKPSKREFYNDVILKNKNSWQEAKLKNMYLILNKFNKTIKENFK